MQISEEGFVRRCEAMVAVRSQSYDEKGEARVLYTMCGAMPVERHHRLTRARGGKVLDAAGETWHLMDLCNKHHRMADGKDARAGGLVIDGYVTTCSQCGAPDYEGPDEYLTRRYGPAVHLRCVRTDEAGDHPGS